MTIRTVRAALLVAAMVLTGCATSISGHGAGSAEPSGPAFPSDSRTLAPLPSSSAAPSTPTTAPPSSTAPLATRDITDIKYSIPKGFVTSTDYHPVSPLEKTWKAAYLIPANTTPGLDVMSITLYSLPAGAHLSTIALQVAQVHTFDARTNTRALNKPHVEIVGGLPAVQENAFQSPNYRYSAWYVFGKRHFVLVSCQVDKHVNVIAKGCSALLKSMRLS